MRQPAVGRAATRARTSQRRGAGSSAGPRRAGFLRAAPQVMTICSPARESSRRSAEDGGGGGIERT
eukprot:6772711-Pyramimonas_sp.AAC.1